MKHRWTIPIKTSAYVMLSSDYSQQEPKITAFTSQDPKMIQAFKDGKDIYATIASVSYNVPYEECLEFHPITGEYQAEGKKRRSEAKTIVLGICYGRSTITIAEQLFGSNEDMTDDEKIKAAQKIYDSVLSAFPNLKKLMEDSRNQAKQHGYVETFLGRRRHIPDMQLPEFEFKAMPGYINPDVDVLDPSTMINVSDIPERVVTQLKQEFSRYRYFGQIVKRTKELADQKIRVINNRPKITEASRQCTNCVDFATEILTCNGWKHYDEISKGDSILSYDMKYNHIVRDAIEDIIVSDRLQDAVSFKSHTFSAISTSNHRWVCCDDLQDPYILTTECIEHGRSNSCILRCAGNTFIQSNNYSDSFIQLLGKIFTKGHYTCNGIEISESTKRSIDRQSYESTLHILSTLDISFSDIFAISDNIFANFAHTNHTIYIPNCDIVNYIKSQFPDKYLTYELLASMSQMQATLLMNSMLNYTRHNAIFTCESKLECDMFQHLCVMAGCASSVVTTIRKQLIQYIIHLSSCTSVNIHNIHKSHISIPGVWCVTTHTGTWVARRDGHVYITGNSRIQGGAADMTKMAILSVESNKDWHKLGGVLINCVHDELIAEVPIDCWKEGGEVLSDCMCGAASFLPFSMKCDVETSLRWYGLSYPCPYDKPESLDILDNLSESNICWLQYMMVENEYILPVHESKNGEPVLGDKLHGVDGIWSTELASALEDWQNKHNVSKDNLIEALYNYTVLGEQL